VRKSSVVRLACRYLLDYSSFLYLLQNTHERKLVSLLRRSVILDLGLYQIGEELISLARRGSVPRSRIKLLGRALGRAMRGLQTVSLPPEGLPGALDIAQLYGISFLDACIIKVAMMYKLAVVTQREDLAAAATKFTRCVSADRLIS
jgi:predicted nucleic acid-binding protein